MIPVWDCPDGVGDFVSLGLWGRRANWQGAQALGFFDPAAAQLAAGVVFHNYEPEAGVIEVSAYSTRRDWLTRDRLRLIFGYPFDTVGVRICVARISEHNTRTLRIWRALGADLYPIPDLRAPGEAEVVATLRRDAWQHSIFMRQTHG